MSLLFNMLSRLVIVFLPSSKHLLISWLQSPPAVIWEPPQIKSVTVSIVSPSICHEVMRPDVMIFIFWMLCFKPAFSFSSFILIKRLFSFSSSSPIIVVSSEYLRLFLPAILIPACTSSSLAFHMMYSNHLILCHSLLLLKGDSIQPLCMSPPILNQSAFLCLVLLLLDLNADFSGGRQGIPISENFPQFVVIHTVKGFSVVNEAEINVFLGFSCFFYDPTDVVNLISGSSAFSKSSLNILMFSYCWSLTWRILSITLLDVKWV